MVMASLLLQGGTVLTAIALYTRLGKGAAIPLPAASPLVLLVSLLLALLGFLFWFAFFGAVAATIDDPHNNSRGGLMMLPLAPIYLAYAVAAYPDLPLVRVLSWIPPMSPSVMSARLILSRPAAWEVVLAIVLLFASIWLLRRRRQDLRRGDAHVRQTATLERSLALAPRDLSEGIVYNLDGVLYW